ncbi:MAG: PorV/PorQ family protein [Candidatus Zixiibacteriota bacterium]
MRKLSLLLIFLLTLTLASQSDAASGLKLLTVDAGARPSGMGGAFVSITADPYSTAYNPAASFGVGPLTGSLGYNTYWENVRIETGYISFEKKSIVFSTGVQFAVVSDLQGRQTPTSEFYPFDAHDVSIKTGAAFRVDKDVVFGFMLGWLFEKIDVYRGNAFCLDLGLLTQPYSNLNAGLAVQNLGSKIKLREEEIDLPTTFRAGLSYRYRQMLPAADIVVLDDEFHLHLGGEYDFGRGFTLRGGYRAGYDLHSFSAGAGFSRRNIRIDYAFVPYKNDFSDSHLFNLTFTL